MQTGKESFRRAMLLIAFGVILFAAVTHLQDLWMGFMGLMGLFSPILLAGAFALILNVPVRGFERIFARLDRRNHLKPGTRNMLGLTLTLLLLPLVLAVVRMLSRNRTKRAQENLAFLKLWNPVRNWFQWLYLSIRYCKKNRYFLCPNCGRIACVPKKTGRVTITCKGCKTRYDRKA